VKRRELITPLGGAVAAWPLAQPRAVIGFVNAGLALAASWTNYRRSQ
jgi:CBS-domain-containing membrane protein